jgi:anti-sigma28 factor (negative regulator of flagellin synthesis)
MTRIAGFGGVTAGRPVPDAAQHGPRAAAREQPVDRAEVSAPTSDAESELQQRIAEIRARIADGTYVTPEKLECVARRLLADCMRK